jgi:putative ABC transport system permease protein
LGVRLAKQIFGTVEAAVGKFVSVREEYYQVVGVVSGVQLHDQEQFLFAPVTTVVARKYANVVANRIYVRCRTWDDVKPVAASLETTIRSQQVARHLVIEVGWEQLERLVSVIWWVELFIYVASAVTLSLGGFGIWNGMMSSVTARTREIGLKKSMGAEDSDILKQFLSEALLLSVVAVVVGVGLGRAIVVGVSKFLSGGIPDALFIRYSLACLAFSILLGLVAGFYPALRASKLDVVAALKFE